MDFGIPAALKAAASNALNPPMATLLRPPPTAPIMARRPDDARRLNIWEVRAVSYCSIVGTRLTLSELRRIAKKCRFADDPYQLSDYDVHGMIVSQMNTDNSVSRAVTKHLNVKFEGALRKCRTMEGEDAFLRYWDNAVEAGLAPGAYWALVSHPHLPLSVEARLYGEIHMMSHMCGASNRGDARAIAEAQRARGAVARRLTAQIADRDRRLKEAQADIVHLRARVRSLEPLAAECQQLRGALAREGLGAELAARVRELDAAQKENARLRQAVASAQTRSDHLRSRLEARTQQWMRALQEWRGESAKESESAEETCDGETADLCGRCLLYVGGRPQTVCQLRHLVARRNGRLLHHDGGLEQSQARLGELVRQADEVFFPVDCVSHGAMDFVKSLCDSHGKPMTPLRTASVTTFLRAIEPPAPR
jgi:Uncharacterized protein conserved in bacteria (DUF2325)